MTSPSGHSLPAHISPQETPDAGNCLFSSKEIAAGELVFHIDRPLALALDEPRLRETCEGCLRWMNGNSMGDDDDDDDDAKRLKDCLGCKVVRYCGKVGDFFLVWMLELDVDMRVFLRGFLMVFFFRMAQLVHVKEIAVV